MVAGTTTTEDVCAVEAKKDGHNLFPKVLPEFFSFVTFLLMHCIQPSFTCGYIHIFSLGNSVHIADIRLASIPPWVQLIGFHIKPTLCQFGRHDLLTSVTPFCSAKNHLSCRHVEIFTQNASYLSHFPGPSCEGVKSSPTMIPC
jgi:hypothetical protein